MEIQTYIWNSRAAVAAKNISALEALPSKYNKTNLKKLGSKGFFETGNISRKSKD